MQQQDRNPEQELDSLFQSYRAASPEPEASARFTPLLWERIEANRSFTFSMRRWTQTVVTAAAALCALMAILLFTPREPAALYAATYVEVLSDAQAPDVLAYVDFEQGELGNR